MEHIQDAITRKIFVCPILVSTEESAKKLGVLIFAIAKMATVEKIVHKVSIITAFELC